MSDATVPTFGQLIDLLVAGNEPEVGYRGLYVESDLRGARQWRVWRWRAMARIEDSASGRLHFTAGAHHFWRAGSPREPDLYARREGRRVPPELEVLMFDDPESYWRDWLGRDAARVERSMRAVSFASRPAWRFSAPRVKGGSPWITVDAALGLVTHSAVENGTELSSWSDLRLEPDLREAFFEPGPQTLPESSWPPQP